jgi:AraC family transcriptional regulator
MQAADSSIKVPSDDLPAAVPALIEAAVAAFDADRDNSRRYLLRASALLSLNRRVDGSASTPCSKSRGGLSAWQLKCVVEYIETRLADKITATDLANHIDVGLGQFFRAFKVSVGVSPIRYVAMRRVDLVCTMLTTTREPLSQVALACGLSDQAHLCKLFRRAIGMSPTAWRRAMTVRDTTQDASGEHLRPGRCASQPQLS